MVALFGIQFLLRRLLQVRRLSVDEQFVDREPLLFRKRAEIDPEFDDGQQIERFFRAHGVRISQNAVGAADLVPECVRFLLDQDLPRVVFLINNGLDHFGEPGDNLVLFFTERGLV